MALSGIAWWHGMPIGVAACMLVVAAGMVVQP
jgi:hypothetical protein